MQRSSAAVRLCSLLLPFLLLFKCSPSATAAFVCDPGNYYTGSGGSSNSSSAYETNLKRLLASLSSLNASLSGFKSDFAGREPDRIEGLVLCRGDTSADECGSCLRFAAGDILNLCPRNKNATAWYQGCFLHYSDGRRVLSSVDNVPRVILRNVENQTDANGFVKLFRDVIMNGLAAQAATNSPKRYATAAVNFTKLQVTVYGMAQCTPDLSAEECSRCLQDLKDMAPEWFAGRKGGGVLGIRCAMRFENDPFFHGTPTYTFNNSDSLNLGNPPTASSKSFPLIGVGVGIFTLFLLIGIIVWLIWFWKKRQLLKMRTRFFQQNGGLLLQQQFCAQGIDAAAKMFTIEELKRATSNFSEAQIVGRGGHGTVYRGTLKDNRVVAIKKSIALHQKHSDQFINEIVLLSQINHRNIIKLLGCCLDTEVPLLVYEFIPNGSLFAHIHGDQPLSWSDRLRVAAETAGALAFLHGVASTPIIHRDVKSTNILLDQHFTAKVSDFGASRSVQFDQTHLTTLVQGTRGYLDPEYAHTSQLTEKSDVYSFGVVLAELLTGELPISFERPETQSVLLSSYFVYMFDQNSLTQVIDPKILVEAGEDQQLLVVAQVARSCLDLNGKERPTMKEVARQLEGLEFGAKFKEKHTTDQHVEELASAQFMHELFSSVDIPR